MCVGGLGRGGGGGGGGGGGVVVPCSVQTSGSVPCIRYSRVAHMPSDEIVGAPF